MRILHLLKYPLYGSGSGTYARMLIAKLAELHPKDKYAIFCSEERTRIPKVKIYPFNLPFKVVATGHPSWPGAYIFSQLSKNQINKLYLSALKQVIEVVNDFQPDVIHVHHEFYFTWIANYLRAIYGIYYVVTVHGTGLLTAGEDKRWVPLTKDALYRAWKINAVSDDTRKWLYKIYGRGLANITRIIPGGADLSILPKIQDTKLIEKKYHLEDKKIIIFVGKIEKHKGIEYLIKAASRIKADIFIIGSGTDEERLKALTLKLNLTNIYFLGHFGQNKTRELYEFYFRAIALVVPSVWDEPLGLVVLEAMACGTPVIASKRGGIPSAVKDRFNGFLVRARSAKDIAAKVNLLIDKPDLRDRLSIEAKKLVLEKFNWEILAKKFHNFYGQAHEESQKRLRRMKLPLDIKRQKKEIKGPHLYK